MIVPIHVVSDDALEFILYFKGRNSLLMSVNHLQTDITSLVARVPQGDILSPN